MSIGMPAYNSGRFVRTSLESLLHQHYSNIEVIVSDDGSSDETGQICEEFGNVDRRVIVLRGDHRGERENFNIVLSHASGDYFMWAADHDLWDPRYVAMCVAALEGDSRAVLAYSRSVLIDEVGEIVGDQRDSLGITQERAIDRYRALVWRLVNCNAIYGLMRTAPLKATGGYGPYPAPDHLILARMALVGTFIQVPQTLYFRRQNRAAETHAAQLRRQVADLMPEAAPQWLSRPASEWFLELRDAHLAAVLTAPISYHQKALGVISTLACFSRRFGVKSRLWPGPGHVLDRIPTAVLGAGPYEDAIR